MEKFLRRVIPIALAAVLGLSPLLPAPARAADGQDDIAAAVDVLRQMENGDPEAVMEIIRRQERERMAAEREDMRQKLLDGEIDVWSQLKDYVILGDSRPAGFYYYSLLPAERVMASAGDTIREIEPRMEDIIALAPARAYLSFGINDINIGYWDTPEEYTAEFVQVLDMLRAALPDMEIYVNSILPVQDWALYKGEKWPEAPIYNEALREMCREQGVVYIDNDEIVAEHQALYDSDGIHFQKEFYTYWVTNFVLAAYYGDGEEPLP